MKLDTSALQAAAQTIGVALDRQQLEAFEIYFHLLYEWNQRLNLTSVTPEDALRLHFLDSLTLTQAVPPAGKVIDIGTGAGFPGMALKIAFPDIKLTVLDSIAKKLAFIETLSKELKVTVEIVCGRAEASAHDPRFREQFDLVVSRAVADLEVLSQWTLPFLKIGAAAVAMKSRDSNSEVEGALERIAELGGSAPKIIDVTIPGTAVERRLIVIGKVQSTPPLLPKRGNVKNKRKK